MRVIRHRAKCVNDGPWVHGSFIENPVTEDVYIGCYERDKSTMNIELILHAVDPDTVGEYVEYLDAYEGDYLSGSEEDEYGSETASWVGEIKYRETFGRIMIYEEATGDWYEVDDYEYDTVVKREPRPELMKTTDMNRILR